MRILELSLLLFALALGNVACSAKPLPDSSNGADAPIHGKRSAPISIDAELGTDSARVELRFEAAVDAATIRVHGADGLVVTSSDTPIAGEAFARGSSRVLEIRFTAPITRSDLVISASTTRNGVVETRVSSFAVGEDLGSRSENLEAATTVTTEGSGERIRVMRVDEN